MNSTDVTQACGSGTRADRGAGRGTLFLGAGDEMTCGVGHFTQRLFETVRRSRPFDAALSLTRRQGSPGAIWRAIGSAESVVCNLPLVAWKRVILRPLLALLLARLRGRRTVLMLHEWGGLNWMRRATYRPAVLLADRIVLFSPLVREELRADPIVGGAVRRAMLAPLPPNFAAPDKMTDTPLRQEMVRARREGRLVVGHFGSIYPGKQPEALLAVGAALKALGHRPLLVYIGSFIRGTDDVEAEFRARVAALGLEDDVRVSGFVGAESDLFGLFAEIDAFCYPLAEGLSARRGSILTAVQSGRPVIVTEPARPDELAHHPGFQALIASEALVLVGRADDSAAYARAILDAAPRRTAPAALDFGRWWADAAAALAVALGR